jgi:DNA-binding NtrC family response regulator/tetratricopeptide (TPR) repeat protein
MEHAQTIAMATDLLAEGRAEDVVQMIDPLLEPVDAPAASTGQLLLRALRAQVEVTHRDDTERALDLLASLGTVGDLCTCVRAEVALWRGWAHARRHSDSGEAVRALRLLDEADGLFESIHDPRGRCWALLGRAQAFFAIDEYALMREVLRDATALADKLNDKQIDRWRHELSIPALRFEGRYEDAERHVDALRSLGKTWNDRRIRGYAAAHAAALRYDLGQPPPTIIDTAETAEALLRRVDNRTHYPLLAAYHAHVGALLRRGHWSDALSVIDEAEDAVRDDPVDQAHLQTLRARIALRRDNLPRAQTLLDDLIEQAHHLPHGLQRSHVALLQGEILARQNDLDEAYTWMQRAHRNARETGHRGNQLRTLLTLARTATARSDLETAQAHLEAADEYDDYFSVLPYAVLRFSAEGTIAQTDNRSREATDAYRLALSAAQMMQDRYRTASLQLALAQLEDDDRAQALATAARSTFDAIGAEQEKEVAAALTDHTNPSGEDAPSPSDMESSSSTSTTTLAATLAQASLSLPLVAKTWMKAVTPLLPDRWLGVYRLSEDGIAFPVHERGTRPNGLQLPSGPNPDRSDGSVQWIPLRSSPPTLVFGVEVRDPRDSDWQKAEAAIRNWKPLVRLALERALLHQKPDERPTPDSPIPVDGFVAESDAMQAVANQVHRIRTSHSPVLITGEGGSGKRLLARAVHATSERADGPLRHVACASMQQEPLAERLFGTIDSDGTLMPEAVHEADGGTLVIEDLDALPSSVQSSLLHLLEAGEAVPEGGTEAVPVDVRVLATTSEHLDEQVRNNHFRPALWEYMNVISLHVPPLRERRADIPLLVRHFLDALRPTDSTMVSITQPAMEALLRYDWPGNVRQLRNELERALVHVSSEPAPTIDRDVLLDTIVGEAKDQSTPPADDPDAILHPNQSLDDVLAQTEAAVIERVLRACDGQVTASAEVLGLSRQGLYKKMKRLDIDASTFQSSTDPEPTPAS